MCYARERFSCQRTNYYSCLGLPAVSYTHLDVYKRQVEGNIGTNSLSSYGTISRNIQKLFPINRATTKKILDIIIHTYIPELGTPRTIITDHTTQFKGQLWTETLLRHGIRSYKTSVYHPSSNPAERVLREVGRILRTYCFDQQRK